MFRKFILDRLYVINYFKVEVEFVTKTEDY